MRCLLPEVCRPTGWGGGTFQSLQCLYQINKEFSNQLNNTYIFELHWNSNGRGVCKNAILKLLARAQPGILTKKNQNGKELFNVRQLTTYQSSEGVEGGGVISQLLMFMFFLVKELQPKNPMQTRYE